MFYGVEQLIEGASSIFTGTQPGDDYTICPNYNFPQASEDRAGGKMAHMACSSRTVFCYCGLENPITVSDGVWANMVNFANDFDFDANGVPWNEGYGCVADYSFTSPSDFSPSFGGLGSGAYFASSLYVVTDDTGALVDAAQVMRTQVRWPIKSQYGVISVAPGTYYYPQAILCATGMSADDTFIFDLRVPGSAPEGYFKTFSQYIAQMGVTPDRLNDFFLKYCDGSPTTPTYSDAWDITRIANPSPSDPFS